MIDLKQFKEIKINGQAVVQLSLGGSVVWKKGGDAFKYDYAVINALGDKESNIQYQYDRGTSKWYSLNNLGELEPYGVLEAVASLDDATYYKGKLVTVGDSEYEWANGQWDYLGEKEGGFGQVGYISQDLRETNFPTDFYITTEDIEKIGWFNIDISMENGDLSVNGSIGSFTYRIVDYDQGGRYNGTAEVEEIDGVQYVHFSCPDYPSDSVFVTNCMWWNEPLAYYGNSMVYPKRYEKITYNTKDGYYYDTEDEISEIGKNIVYNIDGYLYKNVDGTYERGNNGNPYAKASAFASDTTITKMKFKDEVIDKIGNSTFTNCPNLSYIEFEETPPTIENAAFNGVAQEGTLVCDDEWYDNLSVAEINRFGTPYYWRIGYFYIEALVDGSIGMTHYGTNETTTKPVMEYSLDETIWTEWDYSRINVKAGDKVYFRGTNTSGIGRNTNDYSRFSVNGRYNVGGNILSLLYNSNFRNYQGSSLRSHSFKELFYSTDIVEYKTPLPTRGVSGYSCQKMFASCSKLTKAPKLMATSLATYCYSQMFYGCSSLVEAPELPATSLATSCYNQMFSYCSSLVEAPELPALVVSALDSLGSNKAYYEMFYGCTKLNKVRCKAMYYYNSSTKITSNIATNWLNGVSSTGTFYKNPDWSGPTSRSANTIPSGWTIRNWDEYDSYIDKPSTGGGSYGSDSGAPDDGDGIDTL